MSKDRIMNDPPIDPDFAVRMRSWVVARTTDGMTFGLGNVVAWIDQPTFEIERPNGSRFMWRADLVYPTCDRDTIEGAIIAKLQEIADTYPETVFTPEGRTPDGIAGTAIRECMLGQIRMMREARDD